MKIPSENVKSTILDSGLSLVSCSMPGYSTISIGLFVRLGARYESPESAGKAHLIEHLLFKGSKKYSSVQINELIEGKGGSLNAYTAEEDTCFYVKTFPQYFEEVMDVLLDLFTSPTFNEEDFEKEKHIVIEEIRSYEDQPSSYIQDLFSTVIWPDHPLGNMILGTEESLEEMTTESLHAFFQEHYTLPNISLSVAGNVSHDVVLEWAKKHEHEFLKGKANTYPLYQEKQLEQRKMFYEAKSEQCYVQLGFPVGNRYSPDIWPLRILNTIVGENMSSRLYRALREDTGWVYNVSSGVQFYEDIGCFFVQFETDLRHVQDCISATLQQMQVLTTDSISDDELQRAKNYLKGCSLQDMESTLSTMLWFGDHLTARDTLCTTKDFCNLVDHVTVEDVLRVSSECFQLEQLNIIVLGSSDEGLNAVCGIKS